MIRVKIGVEHAASGEAFDDTEFLNAEQDECCPDIIEKLNGNEQNPQRNFVLLRPDRESDTIMSNKHGE